VAVARFQLMAAAGLARWEQLTRDTAHVVVVGSGPVAVGCVLELLRRAVTRVTVVTQHPSPAVAGMPEVTVVSRPQHAEQLVIDCTGRAGQSLLLLAPGGVLGVLGTPADDVGLPAAVVHRRGIAVAGMHELAGYSPADRQGLFIAVLADVTRRVSLTTARSWCQVFPGEQAERLFRELAGPHRPVSPFLLLDWS
jgi:threonine dehydrogenase-like Zn-dependent dehydrogenase